jgi:hypothetical protein
MIGATRLLYSFLKGSEDSRYAILTIVFSSALIGLPMMGMPRIFGFSLLLSSTLSIKGLSEILRSMRVRRKHLLGLSVFLFILCAFTYGIVANSINSFTGEVRDMSLYGTPEKRIMESDNLEFKRLVYWGYEPYSTVRAAKWFLENQNPEKGHVYTDSLVMDGALLRSVLPKEYGGRTVSNLTQPSFGSIQTVLEGEQITGYVFLSYHNIIDNFIYIAKVGNATFYRTSDYLDLFNENEKIYDNGAGEIYLGN